MKNFLKCPYTNEELEISESFLISKSGNKYKIEDGIYRFLNSEKIDNQTKGVREFYIDDPFPNYNDYDSLDHFVEISSKNILTETILKLANPGNSILEFGCGTGQLSNIIAATGHSRIFGADLTIRSLELANKFKKDNKLTGINFFETDIFNNCFKENSFDIIISNGVLHHTKDPYKAFEELCKLLKPGGFIIIGLYNKISRLRNSFIKYLSKIFGKKIISYFDPIYAQKNESSKKSWYKDQYKHVLEERHTFSEVHKWFKKNNINFINSIPSYDPNVPTTHKVVKGDLIDQFNVQFKDLFTNVEGGLFVFIGKKFKK